ncbi:preprotein translocase subunit SecG [Phenylobacterium sp. J426]|uniref:preprotein translocase subunit SecG n=1 Tax=Phenylobacterium sp. J426 TaxID=2898439 RepID=UPI002150EDD1|nr:preprotein translocase subunit SecG [Phenylobacterium sp. J426]MCR5875655.1 preprotein translocase subunit SecG [Phenylobacterium sp. J426]
MLLTLLLVIEVIVAFFLIVVVLLQRSEGGALGMGGGPSGFMTARGAGDLLTRTTWILGAVFFALGLLLTVMAGRERGDSSVVDRLKVDAIDPNSLNQPRPQPPAGQPNAPQQAPSPFQAPAPVVGNPFAGEPVQPTPQAPAQPQ